jgi:hypothetical protein
MSACALLQAEDITIAEPGFFTKGPGDTNVLKSDHHRMILLCRKDTTKLPVGKTDSYDWYKDQEIKLYNKYHDPDNGQMVYYAGSYESPKIDKKNEKGDTVFRQDIKAAPAECRLYFVVKYKP